MEKWIYVQGTSGQKQITVPEVAGKEIGGRVYRNGIEYRPTDTIPAGKEFNYNIGSGLFTFAFPFDENENLDIPYEEI